MFFLKNVLKETCTSFNAKFRSQSKDRKSSCHVRRILAIFYELIELILTKNNVKGLRDTIILKEIKFEGVCYKIELKKMFPKTIIHKLFQTKFNFHVK